MYQNTFTSDATTNTVDGESLKALSRVVFSELMDGDLLGFLLSSRHFKSFIKGMEFADGSLEGQLARELLADGIRLRAFHEATLSMYSGAYIAECQHGSHDDLMLDLDAKFLAFTEASNLKEPLCEDQGNHVELAWKYRHECGGGHLFNI